MLRVLGNPDYLLVVLLVFVVGLAANLEVVPFDAQMGPVARQHTRNLQDRVDCNFAPKKERRGEIE
jgi:hypothetical protein